MLVLVSAVQPLARRLLLSDAVLLAIVGVLIGAGSAYVLSRGVAGSLASVRRDLRPLPHQLAGVPVRIPAGAGVSRRALDRRAPARARHRAGAGARGGAVVATTAAIGLALQPIAGQPLTVCLLLGAIVATTDPSAVTGVFRDIGADARLTRLVEGESLLNDAAAIALFTLLLDQVTLHASPDLGAASVILVASMVGGAAVGYALARLALAAMPLLSGPPCRGGHADARAAVRQLHRLRQVPCLLRRGGRRCGGPDRERHRPFGASAAELVLPGRFLGDKWHSWQPRWCSCLLPCWCRG